MAVVSIVKLSELKGAKRIDADRYHVKFLGLEDNLRRLSVVRRLKSLIVEPVRTGHTPKDRGIYEEDEKIYFIKTDTLRDDLIDFENSDFLPAWSLCEQDYLKPKDVVVTIIGAHFDIIGRAAIFLQHYPQTVVNQNIVVIKPDEKVLNPFYLMVFLNSKYGRQQLWMLSRQTEQVNLNCREVEELLVPIFDTDFQKEIESLAKSSSKFVEKSKSLYTQAEKLLLEEFKLTEFKPKYELTYTANLSKAFRVHRIDAEYFQPAYDEVERHLINNFDAKPIGKIEFVDVTTGQYTEEYVEKSEGKPYIRGTDLRNGTIETDDLAYIALEDQNESKKAKEGDVVVTRVGTIGLSARIPKECEGGTVSDNLIRLRFAPKKLNSYYLTLFLGSLVGINSMIRNSRGSVQQRLNQETLKEIVVPILPDKTQQKIASLAQQSHEARKKAKELLGEAKRKVEETIKTESEKASNKNQREIENMRCSKIY